MGRPMADGEDQAVSGGADARADVAWLGWAVVLPRTPWFHVEYGGDEASAWKHALGWPDAEEIEHAKAQGARAFPVTILPTASHPQGRTKDLTDLLREAKLQIEYLHDKFQQTGSGNAVLARIDSMLNPASFAPSAPQPADEQLAAFVQASGHSEKDALQILSRLGELGWSVRPITGLFALLSPEQQAAIRAGRARRKDPSVLELRRRLTAEYPDHVAAESAKWEKG